MNLYLLSQDENNGYDTYDSVVVAAKSENDARNIKPDGSVWGARYSAWCPSPDDVTVQLIGKAVKGTTQGIICASFNAG